MWTWRKTLGNVWKCYVCPGLSHSYTYFLASPSGSYSGRQNINVKMLHFLFLKIKDFLYIMLFLLSECLLWNIISNIVDSNVWMQLMRPNLPSCNAKIKKLNINWKLKCFFYFATWFATLSATYKMSHIVHSRKQFSHSLK